MCKHFLAFVGMVLCAQLSFGQVTTATISGTVRDSTGGVVPGATVRVRNVETGVSRTLSTDQEGRYRAPNLSLGTYEVQTETAGFQTAVRTGITLTVGREALVDLTLEVGGVTEKVEVRGEAPLVDTSTATVSGLVDDRTIRDLPLIWTQLRAIGVAPAWGHSKPSERFQQEWWRCQPNLDWWRAPEP